MSALKRVEWPAHKQVKFTHNLPANHAWLREVSALKSIQLEANKSQSYGNFTQSQATMSTLRRYPSYSGAPLRELMGQVSNDSFEQQVLSQNSVHNGMLFVLFCTFINFQ